MFTASIKHVIILNMNTNIIYLITNLINDKKYVGLTTTTLERRWASHKCASSGCGALSRAIKKYGQDNFKIEIIFQTFNKEDLIFFEEHFISYYASLAPKGYNLKSEGTLYVYTEEARRTLTLANNKNWQNDERRQRYSAIMKKRVSSGDLKDNYKKNIKPYIDNKKEPIVGVNVEDKTIIKFDSILTARKQGFNPDGCLFSTCVQTQNISWFYDEGQENEHFIFLTELKIGGFGNYRKNGKYWDNTEHKQDRINSMIDAAKDRAKPLIAVSRFDGSIVEFPSINDAIKKGYTWGNIRQSLVGECQHAYNYCWFYKKEDINYVEKAREILGKFDSTNIKPIVATQLDTGKELTFENLEQVVSEGFDKKAVRQVLTGRRNSYKGYTWKFNN
jgi:group I intron endonuclease